MIFIHANNHNSIVKIHLDTKTVSKEYNNENTKNRKNIRFIEQKSLICYADNVKMATKVKGRLGMGQNLLSLPIEDIGTAAKQARRLRELDKENSHLKDVVSDLSLDKLRGHLPK